MTTEFLAEGGVRVALQAPGGALVAHTAPTLVAALIWAEAVEPALVAAAEAELADMVAALLWAAAGVPELLAAIVAALAGAAPVALEVETAAWGKAA